MKVSLAQCLDKADRVFINGVLVEGTSATLNQEGETTQLDGRLANNRRWRAPEQKIELNTNGHAVVEAWLISELRQTVSMNFYKDRPLSAEDLRDEEVAGEADALPHVWDNNAVQFPRLLAEIVATQDKLDLPALAQSMDLTLEEVNELFDRAQSEWETIKAQRTA